MAQKTFNWTAPTSRVDGSPIAAEDMNYRLYIDGKAFADFPGTLNPDGEYEWISDFTHGDYTAHLTAIDIVNDLESAKSNPIPFTVRAAPNPPTNLRVS